jgi:excisionase family DNA binding protein
VLARTNRPLSAQEVSRYLGLCERQVLRKVHNGQIPAKKLGHNWYYSPRKIAQPVGMLDQ